MSDVPLPWSEAAQVVMMAIRKHDYSEMTIGKTKCRGPGILPGASRSRTGVLTCPPVPSYVLQCPPGLNFAGLRVLECPSVSFWFRECVTQL